MTVTTNRLIGIQFKAENRHNSVLRNTGIVRQESFWITTYAHVLQNLRKQFIFDFEKHPSLKNLYMIKHRALLLSFKKSSKTIGIQLQKEDVTDE